VSASCVFGQEAQDMMVGLRFDVYRDFLQRKGFKVVEWVQFGQERGFRREGGKNFVV
jgi:hypothetical protein